MPTILYLNNAVAAFVPATVKGAWNTVNTRAFMMSIEKFGANINFFTEQEATATNPFSVLVLRGITSPVNGPQTLGGHLNVVLAAAESANDAEFYWHLHLWVTQGDTDTVRGTLFSNYLENGSNEWPLVNAAQPLGIALQAPINLTNVNALAGDRIVLELGYVARNVLSASRIGRIYVGTQTGDSPGPAPDLGVGELLGNVRAGSIRFDTDISFALVSQMVTYLVVQAAEIAPAPADISHLVVQVAEFAPAPSVPLSGLYEISPNKSERHDTYNGNQQRKIPDPVIRTAFFGE